MSLDVNNGLIELVCLATATQAGAAFKVASSPSLTLLSTIHLRISRQAVPAVSVPKDALSREVSDLYPATTYYRLRFRQHAI